MKRDSVYDTWIEFLKAKRIKTDKLSDDLFDLIFYAGIEKGLEKSLGEFRSVFHPDKIISK